MKRLAFLIPVVVLAACGSSATITSQQAVAPTVATTTTTSTTTSTTPVPTPAPGERGVVASIADGDTYHVALSDGRTVTVRALGIDTPELAHPNLHITAECGGQHAADITRLLLVGKHVRLVADPAAGDHDHYGRLLRYVFVGSTTFQARLVRAGLAKVYAYHGQPDALVPAWEKLQTRAAQHQTGTWGACPAAIHQAYDFTSAWSTGPAS